MVHLGPNESLDFNNPPLHILSIHLLLLLLSLLFSRITYQAILVLLVDKFGVDVPQSKGLLVGVFCITFGALRECVSLHATFDTRLWGVVLKLRLLSLRSG